ncbi:MAG: YceI family protein [Chloroflexota bacterium]
MNRTRLFLSIGAVVILILGAVFYWSFFRTPEAATGDIGEAVVAVEEPDSASDWAAFEIDSTQSTASFTIAEVLRGDDFTVVGTTDQVGGQVGVDLADPTTAQIGEIVINTRTFVTDNDMRNRAIQNRILFTDDYEFIRFQPTAINGLPESAAVGDSADIEIIGDLTIQDATQSETFAATITYVSAEQISGTASATILYGDYGVEVPLTPSVSFVADELTLTLDFIATATH